MRDKFYKNIGIDPEIFIKFRKIKADLYQKPEDFVVEEIFSGKLCDIRRENLGQHFNSSKRFIHATLVKRDISTFDACKLLASKNNFSVNDIGYCGLKDTYGLTAQRISILNRNKKQLKYTEFNNFFLKDFEGANENLKIRSHQGNHFIVKARNILTPTQECLILLNEFENKMRQGFPNFYGPQRFGIRQNNHKLGRLLMKNEYHKFIFKFLTEINDNELPQIRKIRRKIKEKYGDWKKCLKIVENCRELSDEKELMLNLLKNNTVTSIRNVQISAFFIHAYISYIFNLTLSSYLKKEYRDVKIEKIGMTSKLNKLNRILYAPILKKEKVNIKEIKSDCKKFAVKGHSRNSLFFPKNFSFEIKRNYIILKFNLEIGEYASLVLDFLFDNQMKAVEKLS